MRCLTRELHGMHLIMPMRERLNIHVCRVFESKTKEYNVVACVYYLQLLCCKLCEYGCFC